MRLNSIYIKGFKSFSKETLISFNENVTGIVGPNGSGKSNIVDAIRWVLGEQKPTELRLDNMSDVLFNGTEKRKKSSMAEVTITFDNTRNILPTEYGTVAVSRILYRTGESEYKINDVSCRLKDIRSLFINTGIGPDSYAIIALHMVEDILADSNGSRRFMFEQAAGISKFKKRKKETLSKLKLTRLDLDRIEDLLFEIQTNLKDLEKQARKAERFIKVREQYKEISIALQLKKYDKIIESYKNIRSNIENELLKFRKFETEIAKKEANLQEQKNKILESEKNLSDFQYKINNHVDSLRKNENEKQLLKQKLEFDNNKIKAIEKEKIENKDSLSKIGEGIKLLEKRLKEEAKKYAKFEKLYKENEAKYKKLKFHFDEVKDLADKTNKKKKSLEENKYNLLKTKAVFQNNIDNLVSNVTRTKEIIERLNKELRSLETVKREQEDESFTLIKKIESFKKAKEEKVALLDNLSMQKDKLIEEKRRISRKLDARKNELRLVKSMYDNLEGFPESIKYLNKNWNEKIPLLTDVISTGEEYKVAIESFLEPYLNYFVADNILQAREAIGLLRKTQKGKAHFFILNKLKAGENNPHKLENYISALDIVEYEDKYKNLIESLLSNVYISLIEMDDIYHGDLKNIIILDKSGSFMSDDKSISGGSIGLFEGKKIGRKKTLDSLKKQVADYQEDLELVNDKIKTLEEEMKMLEKESNETEIENYQKLYDEINTSLIKIKINIDNKNKRIFDLNIEIEQNLAKISSLTGTIEENEEKIEILNSEIEALSKVKDVKDTDIELLMNDVSLYSEKVNNAKIDLIRQQNLIESLKKDLQYKIENKISLENSVKNNYEEINKLQDEISTIENNLRVLDDKLVIQYKQKQEFEADLSGIEKEYFEYRNIISSIEDEINTLKHQKGKTQFLINQLKEKQLDLDFKKKAVSERLKIEFSLELKDVLNFKRFEEEEYVLEDKVSRLRNRLDNYGEVNTLAVDAYKEMKERYEHIQNQKEDILNAEKSLKKTISEIEKTATDRFLRAFDIIREHFKAVFTTLFKEGDTCDLLLEEEDKPLESKIKIIAKPKGKRPKTLSQLSGGEKTLTAIALLFSLYLYKPAPFCIFDEVDAPLDDANISKFNNIIREFSANSQFIVVTHNKATMSAVDILYGVFMQEPGISEVAQVDFRNYDELATVKK